ncbi:MAG: GIVxVP protein [Cyanobacteriota bacterium]|nr:GIVxVP protein [Cyanobacteriota bacterium]
MSLNRTAKGIVLVPSLLLGGAFLAAGVWADGAASANRPLALGLGGVLMAAGLLAQLLPESQAAESDDPGT